MAERDAKQRDAGALAEKAAQRRTGLLSDYWSFLRSERKWWLLPILVVLLLAGGIVVLAGSAGAPLLYALF
jgi:hypothetical protein